MVCLFIGQYGRYLCDNYLWNSIVSDQVPYAKLERKVLAVGYYILCRLAFVYTHSPVSIKIFVLELVRGNRFKNDIVGIWGRAFTIEAETTDQA